MRTRLSPSFAGGPVDWPVWLFELLIVIAVIAAAVGVISGYTPSMMFKVRMFQVHNDAMHHRVDIVEHFAINGRMPESDIATLQSGPASVAASYEEHLAGRGLILAQVTAFSRPEREAESEMRIGIVDGTIVVVGRMPGNRRPYQLPIRPAWQQSGAAIAWICGRASPPKGWMSTPGLKTTAPPSFLTFECRGDEQ